MKKLLVLSLVLFSLSACTSIGDSYVDKKIVDLESRVNKLEADNSTLKFHLGISDSQIEVLKEKEAESIEEAKKDAEVEKTDENVDSTSTTTDTTKNTDDIHSIGITSPENNATVTIDPIEFKGEVSSGAKKISVIATGIDYKDEYELKNFKEGDTTFWYKASKQFLNLENGENNYEFIVEFNDGKIVSHKQTINFE